MRIECIISIIWISNCLCILITLWFPNYKRSTIFLPRGGDIFIGTGCWIYTPRINYKHNRHFQWYSLNRILVKHMYLTYPENRFSREQRIRIYVRIFCFIFFFFFFIPMKNNSPTSRLINCRNNSILAFDEK